jgi:uncharacterized protein with HEPN domain
MSRDYRLYLEDILESCRRINRYTAGMSFDHFVKNSLVYDAVLRNIEIIGEAIKQVPEKIRTQYPELDWRRIAGMRDIVAHHYFRIHDEIVWDIVVAKIPELERQIGAILADPET